VKDVIPLGTHDMFLAEIVGVDVDESLINSEGKLCLNRVKLTSYAHGEYYELGKKIGKFGGSVKPKKKKK
jgi:flavin reductase (DIM6/NTAB) family NADH-FMN oxidoreductase RutF